MSTNTFGAPSASNLTKSGQNASEKTQNDLARDMALGSLASILYPRDDSNTTDPKRDAVNNVRVAPSDYVNMGPDTDFYDFGENSHENDQNGPNGSNSSENGNSVATLYLPQYPCSGEVIYKVVTNDGTPDAIMSLVNAKNVFSTQLPKMPKEYITRLVLDRNHRTMVIQHQATGRIIGGICYRPFPTQRFAEIVFCAVTSSEQGKGYGRLIMAYLKEHVKNEAIDYFLTYADNYAIKYFAKQAFSKSITMHHDRWRNWIKDYDGATLMECGIIKEINYVTMTATVRKQRQALIERIKKVSISHREFTLYDPEPKKKKEQKASKSDGKNDGGNIGTDIDTTMGDHDPNNNNTVSSKFSYPNEDDGSGFVYDMTSDKSLSEQLHSRYKSHIKRKKIVVRLAQEIIEQYDVNEAMLGIIAEALSSDDEYQDEMREYSLYKNTEHFLDHQKNQNSQNQNNENNENSMTDETTTTTTPSPIPTLPPLPHRPKPSFPLTFSQIPGLEFFKSQLLSYPPPKQTDPVKLILNARLSKVLTALFHCRDSWPFRNPVDRSVVVDYYNVISHPMDLTTMRAKLNNGLYHTSSLFEQDVAIIVHNCKVYNGPQTPYYHHAEDFWIEYVQLAKKWDLHAQLQYDLVLNKVVTRTNYNVAKAHQIQQHQERYSLQQQAAGITAGAGAIGDDGFALSSQQLGAQNNQQNNQQNNPNNQQSQDNSHNDQQTLSSQQDNDQNSTSTTGQDLMADETIVNVHF